MAIEVTLATPEDLPVVAAILDHARRWLAARGIAQWTQPFSDDWIAEKIAAGEFHIACRAGAPVAVVRLLWDDALFWGERDRADAVYIHTLVVHRDRAGRGIGSEILDWAASEARTRGRSFLRLDCQRENQTLVAYYLDKGFIPAGQVEVVGETMTLLEKALDS